MAAADTQDAGTQQQAAAGSEPASDPAGGAPETDSATPEATGDDAAGDDGAGETQTAALPPEALPDQLRLMFDDGSAGLSDGAESQLDQLARILEENPQQRVQLMAFAEGTEDTASQARRLSLSRALAVRTYLIDRGIRSTRMDVRALGATADEGPLDRVDIVPANR
jgi:outer membrane protein OmpA-like peptidoglycan-associated protein